MMCNCHGKKVDPSTPMDESESVYVGELLLNFINNVNKRTSLFGETRIRSLEYGGIQFLLSSSFKSLYKPQARPIHYL